MHAKPLLLLCCFACLVCFRSEAQIQKDRFYAEFAKIQEAYKGNGPLSFSVHYLYGGIDNPVVIKDSIGGEFRMKGQNSWGVLGETEYICNQDYRITLYRRTASMLLDKRDDAETLAFFQLDSFFARSNEFSLSASKPGEVIVAYAQNPVCDSALIYYDPLTYRLHKLIYYLKAGTGNSEEGGGRGTVQVIFSNYSTAAFDESVFATERYILKKGKEYRPSSTYTAYTLHLASSRLLN